MGANLTTERLLARGAAELAAASHAPRLDAEVLLAHVLGTTRAHLLAHPEERPGPARAGQYLRLLGRRAAGEPLAYLVGHREFWSLRLEVNASVLVPRPETELLVERALALRPEPHGRIADLGTGSGAIALALAHERPQWQVTAIDVSPAALAVARANAERLGLGRVEFLLGSWFAPLAGRRFDLLLSNPPYVAAADAALAQPELQHEPTLALVAGPDGMQCLRAIIRAAPAHLERGAWLLLEHGARQAEQVRRELVAAGFARVRSHCDLARLERVTEGAWDGAST